MKIYLESLWNEFTPEYYNENNDTFEMLFQKYIANAVDNIYHSCTIIEWKTNTDKAA